MVCENCGTKNNDTDKFCANCGKQLSSEPKKQYVGDGSNTPLIILLSVSAVILVALIGVGAFFLLSEPKVPEAIAKTAEAPPQEEAKPMEAIGPTITVQATELPPLEPTEVPLFEPTVVPEAPQEQARQSQPQRDSAVMPKVATRNDFVFIDSATRTISRDELDMLSNAQIRIARNELFARNGRIFESKDMKEYFENQAWYTGIVPAATFDASRGTYMNSVELENMNIINKYEKDYGINQ